MPTNEIVNLLAKFEPETLAALRAKATALGADERVLRKKLGGKAADNRDSYIEVLAAYEALQVAINTSPETLDKLRKKVNLLDRLRLMSEALAAVTGFFSASGVASDSGTRVLAGVACLGAVVSAIIPRLSTTGAGLGKAWATHYSDLVETIAVADRLRRKLKVWLAKYEANQAVDDPSDEVTAADKACETILRNNLL